MSLCALFELIILSLSLSSHPIVQSQEGGVNALQLSQLTAAAKNTGGQNTLRTNRSGSGASTDRSDTGSDSEMGTQRQTDRPLDSSRQVWVHFKTHFMRGNLSFLLL